MPTWFDATTKCSDEIRYSLQCLTVRPWKCTHRKTEQNVVMEVQRGCVWKVATIEGTHSSLPWLWEGYVKLLRSKNYWAENPLMAHAVPGHREAICFVEAFSRLSQCLPGFTTKSRWYGKTIASLLPSGKTNIAVENPQYPGRYHQNDRFSMAMSVYQSVAMVQISRNLPQNCVQKLGSTPLD